MNAESLKARIYLHGVLAQVPTVCTNDAECHALVRSWRTSIQFALAGGPAALLHFRNGAVSFEPARQAMPGLILWYPTDRALVQSFAGSGTPIPIFGIWRVRLLRALPVLIRRLVYYLSLSEPDSSDDGASVALTLALRIRLDALLRSVGVLGAADPKASRILKEAPDGTIALRAPGMAPVGARKRGSLFNVEPIPPNAPNLTLTFASVRCGHDLLAGQIDPAAAIGLGKIELSGLTLLADAVFHVVGDVQALLSR